MPPPTCVCLQPRSAPWRTPRRTGGSATRGTRARRPSSTPGPGEGGSRSRGERQHNTHFPCQQTEEGHIIYYEYSTILVVCGICSCFKSVVSKKSEEVRFFNFPETEKRIGKSKLKQVELQTKVRKDFTIMEKASTPTVLNVLVGTFNYKPGECPSRGLLRDCEIFANLRITFFSSTTSHTSTSSRYCVTADCSEHSRLRNPT